MPRTDLLALTLDDLAALTNRGTVKRAERELAEITCTIREAADGTAVFSWSDGIVCTIPGNRVVAQGTCTCPATECCRHLVRAVLAYQKAFGLYDVGGGAAVATINFVVLLAVVAVYFRLVRVDEP